MWQKKGKRNSPGAGYFADKQLIPRIKSCLQNSPYDKSSLASVDSEQLTQDLRNIYKDYTRKQFTPLKLSVEKALQVLMKNEKNTKPHVHRKITQ